MEPATIATHLRELATYYELDGDRHRTFAYDRAAKAVEAATGLDRLIATGTLESLPHIGPSTARLIGELVRTGRIAALDAMRAQWPPVVLELAQLRGVGVGKAGKLVRAFSPPDLDAVAELCRRGAVRELPGFGKTSEAKILAAIEERLLQGARVLLIDAENHAASLAHHLAADPAIDRVEVCGAVRRWCEISTTLAFAVIAADAAGVADRLATFGLVTSVDRDAIARGRIAATISTGLRCELQVADAEHFGWAMIAATGSDAHVEQLRALAGERGLDLETLAARDEAAIYRALELPWLPPEVRDGTDELAAARAGDDFTDLIAPGDITVATHCHTTASDGKHSLAEMVAAAGERGFGAITITDHSANASYARGLDLARLREQAAEIADHAPATATQILHGTEADILADGALDVPPEMIDELGVIIASVHQRYKLDEDATTRRLITAMRAPFFKIWGHPLGRLVLKRDPIAVRIDEVLDTIAGARAAIEINGDPYRLDLDPDNVRAAARRGIPFVLSSDAHSTTALGAVRYAIGLARRARLRKRDVINARPPDEVAELIRPRQA